jgi:hypothetical protein
MEIAIPKTPAQKEREAIAKLYNKAEAAYYSEDDDNVSDYYGFLGAADRRFAAWKIAYPQDWALEQAENLEFEASEKEYKAAGALTYDADGWITPAEQQARHDRFIAEANDLREQAKKLKGGAENG